jgi:hypothetical protein
MAIPFDLTEETSLKPSTDICFYEPCGPNAKCRFTAGIIQCSCLAGFIGDPPNCEAQKAECTVNDDCPDDKACVLQSCVDLCPAHRCDTGVKCIMDEHRPVCQCNAGYRENGRGGCVRNLSECTQRHFYFDA